jgi:hypothetical protein
MEIRKRQVYHNCRRGFSRDRWVLSGINALKTNTVVIRQMDTHQAQDKAAPAPVNLTVIVIQVSILFFQPGPFMHEC